MKLSGAKYDNSETDCYARPDVEGWGNKPLTLENKPFLEDHIRSFHQMPLNFGTVVQHNSAGIKRAEVFPEEPLWLSDEASLSGATLLTAIDGDFWM